MKVVYGISNVKRQAKPVVLAIGVFDGVHIGHQALIKRALKKAKQIGGTVSVMTFNPHPAHVLRPDNKMPFVVSLEHRLKLFERMSVARCVVVRFSRRFSNISPEHFIKQYLVRTLQAKEVFVGEEFRFGKNRAGTMDFFQLMGQKLGFNVNPVAPVQGENGKVGSSFIREIVAQGKLAKAKKFLGRPASIMGVVVKGDRRGKRLGFPTANIFPENQVIPPLGVYAVRVNIADKMYKGMANVGVRPSLGKRIKTINIETHLFNFKKNIYGKTIIIQFIKKIRNEKTFPSLEKLSAQLKLDQKAALNMLKLI